MVEWVELRDGLYELRHKGVVLGTITRQNKDGRYSLYISAPVAYATRVNVLGQTYNFESLDKAKEAFIPMVNKHLMPWYSILVDYIGENNGNK